MDKKDNIELSLRFGMVAGGWTALIASVAAGAANEALLSWEASQIWKALIAASICAGTLKYSSIDEVPFVPSAYKKDGETPHKPAFLGSYFFMVAGLSIGILNGAPSQQAVMDEILGREKAIEESGAIIRDPRLKGADHIQFRTQPR